VPSAREPGVEILWADDTFTYILFDSMLMFAASLPDFSESQVHDFLRQFELKWQAQQERVFSRKYG
jgi:hypothetical protein